MSIKLQNNGWVWLSQRYYPLKACSVRWSNLLSTVTGQLADTPTRGLPTRGLDDSRPGQVADCTTRGCHRRLFVLSFRFLAIYFNVFLRVYLNIYYTNHRLFVPKTFRSQERKVPMENFRPQGTKVPGTFRSRDFSFTGTFVPIFACAGL